eukprot:Phypoly_transcript_02529.p1 GENE.Phypoly_transcript_02529~~Phypoly_transcript_02529.p1  ORF type:complete len:397 (+),score=32.93 Phypoly_transcript_02529:1556-2746(+)
MKKLSPKKFLQLALQSRFVLKLRGKKQHVCKLPEELLVYIFEFLSIQDLCSVVSVSQTWRSIGFDGYLWKTQSLHYFENPVNRSERRLSGKDPDENWQDYFRRRYAAHVKWKTSQLANTTVTGHVGTVWTLAFDESKLVTGSFDKTIKIWDRNTYKCMKTLRGHSYPIQCLQFSHNMLVTGSLDNTIKMWDTDSGLYVGTIVERAHNFDVFCLQFEGDRIVSGSSDSTVKVSKTKGECTKTLQHTSCVTCLNFKDNILITGSADKTMKMWDLSTGQLVSSLVGHQESIRCLQVDRSVVLSGSNDHSMKLWDLRTTACATTLKGHTAGIRCLQFSGAGLVSGSADKTVKLWDLRQMGPMCGPVSTLLHHQTPVACLQWTNDTLACGFSDSKIKILTM